MIEILDLLHGIMMRNTKGLDLGFIPILSNVIIHYFLVNLDKYPIVD